MALPIRTGTLVEQPDSVILNGGLGYGLGLVVIAVAWVETLKRVLRLSGPLFLASLLLPLLLNHATDLSLLSWLDARWSR